MCPAASQRQPCETGLNGTNFWLSEGGGSQDIIITAIFLSVFYSFFLHPIELLQKEREREK